MPAYISTHDTSQDKQGDWQQGITIATDLHIQDKRK